MHSHNLRKNIHDHEVNDVLAWNLGKCAEEQTDLNPCHSSHTVTKSRPVKYPHHTENSLYPRVLKSIGNRKNLTTCPMLLPCRECRWRKKKKKQQQQQQQQQPKARMRS